MSRHVWGTNATQLCLQGICLDNPASSLSLLQTCLRCKYWCVRLSDKNTNLFLDLHGAFFGCYRQLYFATGWLYLVFVGIKLDVCSCLIFIGWSVFYFLIYIRPHGLWCTIKQNKLEDRCRSRSTSRTKPVSAVGILDLLNHNLNASSQTTIPRFFNYMVCFFVSNSKYIGFVECEINKTIVVFP